MTSKGTIKAARREYAETGTLATDTYMALTNAGLDAEILMAQFEAGEKDNGE